MQDLQMIPRHAQDQPWIFGPLALYAASSVLLGWQIIHLTQYQLCTGRLPRVDNKGNPVAEPVQDPMPTRTESRVAPLPLALWGLMQWCWWPEAQRASADDLVDFFSRYEVCDADIGALFPGCMLKSKVYLR
jgi:hypothetical protein